MKESIVKIVAKACGIAIIFLVVSNIIGKEITNSPRWLQTSIECSLTLAIGYLVAKLLDLKILTLKQILWKEVKITAIVIVAGIAIIGLLCCIGVIHEVDYVFKMFIIMCLLFFTSMLVSNYNE